MIVFTFKPNRVLNRWRSAEILHWSEIWKKKLNWEVLKVFTQNYCVAHQTAGKKKWHERQIATDQLAKHFEQKSKFNWGWQPCHTSLIILILWAQKLVIKINGHKMSNEEKNQCKHSEKMRIIECESIVFSLHIHTNCAEQQHIVV